MPEISPSLKFESRWWRQKFSLCFLYVSYTLDPSLSLLTIFEPFEPSFRPFDWLVDDNNLIDSTANDWFEVWLGFVINSLVYKLASFLSSYLSPYQADVVYSFCLSIALVEKADIFIINMLVNSIFHRVFIFNRPTS